MWPSGVLSLFGTEIGLVFLSLGCLVLDIFLPSDKKKGKLLASVGMAGVAALFVHLCCQWGHFGSAFGGSFSQDGLAFFFKLLFLLAGFFTLFMAGEYQHHLERGHGEFILLILLGLTGLSFLASAADFLLLFVSIETLTISLYIMTAYLRGRKTSVEAGLKYLILGALSTALFLYGLSFIYGSTGSTSYAEISRKLAGQALPLSPPFLFGVALVVSSLGFKIASVPFQLWTPDIYEGAPTPVTAYLAMASKAAGFAALTRLMLTAFGPAQELLALLFAILAALTLLYGNLGAIPQTNIKRLLGYSSIGHAGYLLVGLAAFSHAGKEALLFYLLSYLFSTAGAFLVIVAVSSRLETDEISGYAGLSQKSPLLAAGMLLALLSLAGVPPLGGFFAKFYLLWAGMRAGLLWLVVIGALNVITSLYYSLKIVKVMYLDPPTPPSFDGASPSSGGAGPELTVNQKAIQYLTIAGILVLGIWQGPFVRFVEQVFVLTVH
ncbi:MAG: NADH-quinone oxidoreductase subunit N [Candidatus Omnitrophica bacterium]|nr:NADH-quinone oxidoreductase subunit N [Candidatus Omnitrophota bacterium]